MSSDRNRLAARTRRLQIIAVADVADAIVTWATGQEPPLGTFGAVADKQRAA